MPKRLQAVSPAESFGQARDDPVDGTGDQGQYCDQPGGEQSLIHLSAEANAQQGQNRGGNTDKDGFDQVGKGFWLQPREH